MKKFILFVFSSFLLISCSQEKKEDNKLSSDTNQTQSKKEVKKDSTNNWAKDLNNENAQDAANKLLKGDNSTIIKWNGLIVISDFEIRSRVLINKYLRYSNSPYVYMNGDFIFHRDIDKYWILDKVDFRSESGTTWWNDPVFVKVVDK